MTTVKCMDQRDRKCGADSNLSQSILVDNYIIFHKFALLNPLSKNRKRLTYSYSMNLDNSRSTRDDVYTLALAICASFYSRYSGSVSRDSLFVLQAVQSPSDEEWSMWLTLPQ